ncbi:protein O-glucosyltransferase 2-like [Haliotis cracherodii]|uniref:protein O-glucosyltransferase 2-like n=1 Tax=Haliotis cracherodii TaxID=6455 RepID=UPI0039ECE3F4
MASFGTCSKSIFPVVLIFFLGTVVGEAGLPKSEAPRTLSLRNSRVWGPGLKSEFFLPVRYFYIEAVDQFGERFSNSIGEKAFAVTIYKKSSERVRVWTQVLDRHDGSYIVRYRMYESAVDLEIEVLYQGRHMADSPYTLKGMVYHEKCDCPQPDLEQWLKDMDCPSSYRQIKQDLGIFKDIDFKKVAMEAVDRFSDAGRHSICHYKIIDNKIYRKTYGEHVGFKMFSDALLLSLTRKVKLPNMEFIMNFGDWPLEKRKMSENPIPIFSWCGSDDTLDIVIPTYDITEATLEMMSRVTLDIFSVQGNTGPRWEEKSDVAFWRGRDSREERLQLVQMARQHPDKINASLTNMFFFPKDENKYGKLVKPVSFFSFFQHKYQLNLDGTVAAYRLPYLLAGDSTVMKQNSHYYEHFYKNLEPYVHYVPFKRDLSDLMEKLKWAREHDKEVQEIAHNAQEFVRHQLTPADIYCYHTKLFSEYSKLLKNKPKKDKSFELVKQEKSHETRCDCKPYKNAHDEL